MEFFADEESAISAEADWRTKMNPDYDEARVFPANLEHMKETEPYRLESAY